MENDVRSALTTFNTKIEDLKIKSDNQRRAQKILPPLFAGKHPAGYEPKNNSKFSEALKSLSSQSFQYHGNLRNLQLHNKKLSNLIWLYLFAKLRQRDVF